MLALLYLTVLAGVLLFLFVAGCLLIELEPEDRRRTILLVALFLLLALLAVPVVLAGEPDPFDRHIRDLGHRSFKVRETAQQSLYRLGYAAIGRLDAARERTSCAETRRRLEVICAGLRAERLRWIIGTVDGRYGPNFPMIDAVWLDTKTGYYDAKQGTWRGWFHRRCYPYLSAQFSREEKADTRRWASFRRATREWFVDLLDAGVPVWCLDLLAMEMWRRDNIWIGKGAGAPLDPFWWPGMVPQQGFPTWPGGMDPAID